MRRISVVALVVVLVLAMLVPMALATVHPQSRSECSADAANGTPADSQNPPGITDGPDRDPDHAAHAQPVFVADEHSHKSGGCPAAR